MKKSLLAIAVVLAFALTAAAQSGNMSSKSSSKKTATSTAHAHGMTGCLEQGSAPGSYVLKNAQHPEGVKVNYSGSEDLSKHIGHKVHATGTMSGDTLDATNVKHISKNCTVGSASAGHHHHGSGMSNTSTGKTSGTGATNPK